MAQQKTKRNTQTPPKTSANTDSKPSAALINIMIVATVIMAGAITYILLNKEQYLKTITEGNKKTNIHGKPNSETNENSDTTKEEQELLKNTEVAVIGEDDISNASETLNNNSDAPLNNHFSEKNTTSASATEYTTRSGNYCIAAGSFTDKRNADKHIEKLKKMGLSADLAEYRKGRFSLYRVCIESSTDKESLKKKIYPLREQYGIDFWVVEN
ncbi:MAG: SPOR domain-containing protein [Cytophagaceae bacterium]|nr:SPOR domain-containing protein [Cytophagaceae bacterium]MDW8456639.1 SPOR domain-containing protein [Cytophagaceae bacterium]